MLKSLVEHLTEWMTNEADQPYSPALSKEDAISDLKGCLSLSTETLTEIVEDAQRRSGGRLFDEKS